MAGYRVTAAAVLVRLTGADLIVEQGKDLPEQAPAELVERLLSKGMIEPIPDALDADNADAPDPDVEPAPDAGDAKAPRTRRT